MDSEELGARILPKSRQNIDMEGFACKVLKRLLLRRTKAAPAGVERSCSKRMSWRIILLIAYIRGGRSDVTRVGVEKIGVAE